MCLTFEKDCIKIIVVRITNGNSRPRGYEGRKGKNMKIRSYCIPVSRAVSALAMKWEVNPAWVWDIFEDECGVIKGLGNVVTQEEIDLVEWYICNEILHDRA